MSGAIDRLRTARDGHHALAHVWPADLRDVLSALDAAEAECARLRTTLADAEVTVAAARVHHGFDAADRERAIAERDAARAEAAGLRAVVEGRTRAPTDAEITAHWRAGGAWLASGEMVRGVDEALRLAACSIPLRWIALDNDRTPCPWPVLAAEAAGAALAGEGR